MLGLHAGALLLRPDPALRARRPCSCRSQPRGDPTPSPQASSRAGSRSCSRSPSGCASWIGQQGWRRLHYASFAAFVLALGHALTAGTRPQGHRRPAARGARGRTRDLARPRAHPPASPRTRRPPRDPGRGMTTAGGPGSTSRHPLPLAPAAQRRPTERRRPCSESRSTARSAAASEPAPSSLRT